MAEYSSETPVRVRFAPAPTGMMHLGNVRTALANFLFARKHNGTFIIRLEDTDAQRIFDPAGAMILADLAWLGLTHDEGPAMGGPYGPYAQSERTAIYQDHLDQLKRSGSIYPCFCSSEELERKRNQQIELKKAPRYDRVCLNLSAAERSERLAQATPHIWRFQVPATTVTISDLARGSVSFDLQNFSDFALTRQDGSFTFIFANGIDDITMRITHVFRGEEHISNTALQVLLYQAFNAPVPRFWHMPLIINHEGKKLSKRDFGFSLNDLRKAGYLPEAIINYLALLGSKTPQHEIMDIAALIEATDFEHHASANATRYDEEKLRWVNHSWIAQSSPAIIAQRCLPFLEAVYPAAAKLPQHELERIVTPFYPECKTLADIVPLLASYFHEPELDLSALQQQKITLFHSSLRDVAAIATTARGNTLLDHLRAICRAQPHPAKYFWSLIRLALAGSAEGANIAALLQVLPHNAVVARLTRLAAVASECAP